MKIGRLFWDEWNIEHISRHGVDKDEVEEVCSSRHFDMEEKEKRNYRKWIKR